MIGLTQHDIKTALNDLVIHPDEYFMLNEIYCKHYVRLFEVHYKNKRVSHLYKIFISYNDNTIYTAIKSEDGQKNITRTRNTTDVADRIIFCIAMYSLEKLNIVLYPDFIEGRRILKHLGSKARCRPIIRNNSPETIFAYEFYKSNTR